jgi:hypothetical protein
MVRPSFFFDSLFDFFYFRPYGYYYYTHPNAQRQ